MSILLISLAVVIVIVVASFIYSRQREHRLEGYSGLVREQFVEHFSAQGVPPAISEAIYDMFKEKARSQKFRPSPEMSIEGVFEQLGEDTDDDAYHVLRILGIPVPSQAILERWTGHGIETVSDLVVWTDWVRRQQNSSLVRHE